MSEPVRRAHARRTAVGNRVAAVVGAVVLILLLLLLFVTQCISTGTDHGGPGSAHPASATPGAHGGSSSASKPPSQSARSAKPTSPVGPTATPTTATPTTATPTSATPKPAPTDDGTARLANGPTPSGAPRTGGGGGSGVRDPVLLGTGILLLIAAAASVLFRAWPPDMRA
jgi:hypothetical protein